VGYCTRKRRTWIPGRDAPSHHHVARGATPQGGGGGAVNSRGSPDREREYQKGTAKRGFLSRGSLGAALPRTTTTCNHVQVRILGLPFKGIFRKNWKGALCNPGLFETHHQHLYQEGEKGARSSEKRQLSTTRARARRFRNGERRRATRASRRMEKGRKAPFAPRSASRAINNHSRFLDGL